MRVPVCWLLVLGGCMAHAGLRIEQIFGPEVKTGPYKHPASICALSNGDLYLVYYGGEGEYAGGTAVFASRLTKGATRWTEPREIARDPLRSLGNGVAWQDPAGKLWLFYVVRFGETWSTSRIAVKLSGDLGQTWSDSTLLRLEEGWMVRGKPVVSSSGEWLLPIYHETGSDRERVPPDSTSLVLIRDPRTGDWSPSGRIRSPNGNIQPSLAEISPGRFLALCRRGGGYEPSERGWIVSSESRDGGRTWSPGTNTALPNPNSAVELLRLRSGNLLLVFNDSMNQRTPLVAALSSDGGASWPKRLTLASGRGSFAYPSSVQAEDGLIHVVFTSDDRTVIRRAVFSEDDVLKAPPSPAP